MPGEDVGENAGEDDGENAAVVDAAVDAVDVDAVDADAVDASRASSWSDIAPPPGSAVDRWAVRFVLDVLDVLDVRVLLRGPGYRDRTTGRWPRTGAATTRDAGAVGLR